MKNKKKKYPLSHNGWLYSNNQSFLESIYKNFLLDPHKLDISWKNLFFELSEKVNDKNDDNYISGIYKNNKDIKKKYFQDNLKNLPSKYYNAFLKEKFLNFINAYRMLGHRASHLNPLIGHKKNYNIPELSRSFHKIKSVELNFLIHFNFLSFKKNISSFKEICLFFKKKYCSYIGFEYMHLKEINEKKWLQNYIETNHIENILSKKDKKNILNDLVQSTAFETFLHKKFPGSKRFSLEGCDVLIPALNTIIKFCMKKKTKKIFLGMAHRGRLNVMFNIFKHRVLNMFQESKNKCNDYNRTGDVKYHIGTKKKIKIKEQEIEINLLDNPSHLEIISPVVIGCCKYYLENIDNKNSPLPVIIHGDAAFMGQGVIQETLNMSQTPGYGVCGSIHIIINNQIAFTTSKIKHLRSSTYCTDIAKMIDSPIFHVNADQPESVIFIIKLALKFRYLFKKDVFIDLFCYRRLGHNEVDDPYITQPKMYNIIKDHERICYLYSKSIFYSKNDLYVKLYKHYINKLNIKLKTPKTILHEKKLINHIPVLNQPKFFKKIKYETLQNIAYKLFTLPKNLVAHHQVKKIFFNRKQMANNCDLLDWGTAENLAYATLMYYGITCRLTGEDVSRGTFSHRHAAIICQKKNTVYIPLQNLHDLSGSFHIWDSVLSEESVLAFEYGYALVSSNVLNIWEAQFGDFANGAQIVIDQFISSGLQKWGQSSSLVVMLPHGYEGQGPEHSSGRIERYLQLCAQKNIRICIPTTVSQMYHLLLQQGRYRFKRPLIIFTPKSLLRNPLTFIGMKDLLCEKFHKILLTRSNSLLTQVNRIIFCSGKIYYELLNFYNIKKILNTDIIRIEQLYPFPFGKINTILNQYTQLKYLIWCQEEPKNQGSWSYVYFYFKKYILKNKNKISLKYIGRSKLASTAEGNFNDHKIHQKKIIESVFSVHKKTSETS